MVRAKCVVMNPNRKGILGAASRKAILLYADIIRESNFELSEKLYELVAEVEFKGLEVVDGRI